MSALSGSIVMLLVLAAHSAMANPEVKAAVNVHTGKTMVVDGHQVNTVDHFNRLGRVLRQTCSDQWSNCAVDVVYQGTTYKALFPGGSGCTSVAGTSSSKVSYACQCTTTCPAFCGSSACGTTTVASGSGTTTTTTTTTTQSTTTAAATSGLDTSLAGVQTSIVNLHNTLRRQVPSPGMLQLSWDSGVATVAQNWANQCTFSHPDKSPSNAQYWVTPKFAGTGQNIGQGYAGWSDVINAWYNEINNFQFGVGTTDVSKEVGHYTQLVWNATYAIGCAYKQCPSWKIYVCNYGPAGNINPNQNYPYLAGPACTGTNTCDAGLRTNPCPYVNKYSNCEVDQPGYPALYPNGCGTPATGGLKDSCQATCLCKPQGLIYRL